MAIQTHYQGGETIRITAADLTHADSGPVTSGATVTIELYDSAGALVTSGSGTASGDDWYADLTAPSPTTDAEYTIKATATKSGAVWRAKEPIRVKAF